MSQKGRGKGKGPEVVFDDKARAEYLTGFRKRKQERKQAGRDYLAKKAKEEQLATRKELRNARKEKAAENVREQRKAFGLDAEGESDLDKAADADSDGGEDIDDEDAVPQIHQEEYDSDQHHTHVVVESFDPEQEAFEKATAITTTSTRTPKAANAVSASAATAALSSVEALPPSSRRVNKAKANASLSLPFLLDRASSSSSFSSPRLDDRHTDMTLLPFSSPPITGQSQETSDSHQEENVTHKRLHISGLTAAFSKEDLERRFSTFGTVIALDGLGKRDALGQLRPFAYLTLQAPPQQIKRCMNLLSGSVWKGATLRIGEAKPDYQQRIHLETEKRRREEEEKASHPKKPKRLPPGMGLESPHLDPVDQAAVESGLAWGWKRTPAGHLIRPLRMRPSHPLPRPSRTSTLSRIDATENEEDDQQQQQESSSRRARVNPRPPTKAHRITIDPTRYGAIHLSGDLLESLAGDAAFDATSLGPGEWHCEEILHDDDDSQQDHRLVRWQYTAKDGKVLHEEFAKIPVRVVPKRSMSASAAGVGACEEAEDVMAQLDFDRYSDAGSDDDLFSGFASTATPAVKQVESKPAPITITPPNSNARNNVVVDTADIDDLFADLPSKSSATATTDVNDLFSDLPSIGTPSQQTPQPPQPRRPRVAEIAPTPTPSKKVKGTFVPGLDPDEEDPGNFSDGYDEVAAAAAGPSLISSTDKQVVADAEQERQKTLALLGEMFGSGSDDESPSIDVAQIQAESAEEESESESDEGTASDASSESNSASEAASAEAAGESSLSCSESSSSTSETGDDEMSVDEEDEADQVEEIAAEDEQDVPMADAPVAPVEPVAAPATDDKSRRAAFLLSLSNPASTATQNTSYVPIARFDPGTRAVTPPAPTTTSDDNASIAKQPAPDAASLASSQPPSSVQAGQAEAEGTKVSMSTLKEMFKPQDRVSGSAVTAGFSLGLGGGGDIASGSGKSGGGFSLMDSLGLEFELEDEEPETDAAPASNMFASSWSNIAAAQPFVAASSMTNEAPQRMSSPFFPSSSNAASWNNNDGSVRRWLNARSQEERESDWTRYKESLTQVVKKRHREAARKHKRGFKSLPSQQQQGMPAAVGAVNSRS
ncbi:hypothetical protein EX895_002805 [Sporisorium graminicola]|uniref:RRM domain-containing protein n=1 Tax=Sporisorium graminicola TaxID=280036 RepID=A0A4U7KTZ6_9BASI|nr:hypothetical protein EX895_002805 [Sporisorium graminicola]TKY88095.1 hypothetical protein EX895_002805 [Sporisorium graminicola]